MAADWISYCRVRMLHRSSERWLSYCRVQMLHHSSERRISYCRVRMLHHSSERRIFYMDRENAKPMERGQSSRTRHVLPKTRRLHWHRVPGFLRFSVVLLAVSAMVLLSAAGCSRQEEGAGSGNNVRETDVGTENNVREGVAETENETVKTGSEEADPEQEEGMTEEHLISASRLIELLALSEEEYEGVDLEQLIETCGITEENIDRLNVRFLIKYSPHHEILDVSMYFSGNQPARQERLTEDIIATAYQVSSGTDSYAVYYDLEKGLKYQAEGLRLFEDLNQVEAEPFEDLKGLVQALAEMGVFDWESDFRQTETLTDGYAAMFAVIYEDGSVFRVDSSGLLTEDRARELAELSRLMLGQTGETPEAGITAGDGGWAAEP